MTSRRQELLDAAIELIGERGIHGLTHRNLDAVARLPAGSTSNHFRTRQALLDAVAERFAARERALWEDLAAQAVPTGPQELARTMAEFAKATTGPHRTPTVARYAILVEAVFHPSLRAALATIGAWVDTWFTDWVRRAGSSDPHRHAPVIMNHFTGIVLHQLAIPDPHFDPYPQIEALVLTLIPPTSVEVPDDDSTRR